MKYETAKEAAEFIWNKFENPDLDKKEEVIELLEDLINQELEKEEEAHLYYNGGQYDGVGTYIDPITKRCCKEAGASGLNMINLKITKKELWDYLYTTVIPRFIAGDNYFGKPIGKR